MCEAIRVFVRYELPDEKGKTRRERNEDFDTITPPPEAFSQEIRFLWDWYFAMISGHRRVIDGTANPVPWTEMLAWASATETIVRTHEYAILRAMDAAYCDELNKELIAYRERQAEAQKAEVEAARKR